MALPARQTVDLSAEHSPSSYFAADIKAIDEGREGGM
jgi:hypothetical protein